jgi:hypothetical protein
MTNISRMTTVVLVLAAVAAGCATSDTQPEQFNPQSLVGEWSGEWRLPSVPQITGPYHLTIQAVEGDKVWGTVFSGSSTLTLSGSRSSALRGTLHGNSLKYGRMEMTIDGNVITGYEPSERGFAREVRLMKHKSAVAVMSPRYSRAWNGATKCEATQAFPETETPVQVSAIANALVVARGRPDQPGSFTVRGTPEDKGGLQLFGIGISGAPQNRGQDIPVRFSGRFEGDRFQGPGLFGSRKCVLSIWPADQ